MLRRQTLVHGLVTATVGGLITVGIVSGCSRQHYRQQADQQALELIEEKENAVAIDLPDRSIYGNPRSRYFDATDPDCPPIPPDDAASHDLMHCVYGMKGFSRWHENGEIAALENPVWRDYLSEYVQPTAEGQYFMSLENAVDLALLNSLEYQRNVENLYLSALDVAFERFRFDCQFFAGNTTRWVQRGNEFIHRTGTVEAGGVKVPGTSSSTLTTTNSARMSKLLPAGGTLLVDFANTFVWQFAGSNRNTRADSLLSFTLSQPLLRSGGREVAMEQLTRAERGLLANVRQMERYRHGFLLDVAMGTGGTGGPRRSGGFLGGAGLSGFTGTGTGGFGGVGEASNFGRIGGAGGGGGGVGGAAGGGFAAGVAGNVGGFIGLVQSAQQIRNREANLTAQRENLARVEALFAAGRVDSVQVDQFRQNMQTSRSQYLDAVNGFQRSIENFLMNSLGLPPDLRVQVDQSLVEPFQFSDRKLTTLQDKLASLIERIRTAENPSPDALGALLDDMEQSRSAIAGHFEVVRQDFRHLDSVKEERMRGLASERERQAFLAQIQKLTDALPAVEKQFEATADGGKLVRTLLKPEQQKEAQEELARQAELVADVLRGLLVVQAGVRLEAVVLEPTRLDSEQAFEIARRNRLDMMNQRAEVVDQWRLIAFNADRLESELDVSITGDIGTLDRNIAHFRDQTGSLSASLSFDSPITRLGERNLYRESLINYQRVRREYIQFEDQVKQSLRNTLRRLEQFEQEMELRREAMRIAIRQVDLMQDRLQEPPRPGAAGAAAGLGENVVRDLLAAYADMLQTQNDVMATYLNYQALRMILYRDIGVIRFDGRGLWIDQPLEEALAQLDGDMFIPPPCPAPPSPSAPVPGEIVDVEQAVLIREER
jgi:hypothetical protein